MNRVGSWKYIFDRMKAVKRLINAGVQSRKGPFMLSDLFYCAKHDAFGYEGQTCSGHQLFESFNGSHCRKLSALDILAKMSKRERAQRRREAWRMHYKERELVTE